MAIFAIDSKRLHQIKFNRTMIPKDKNYLYLLLIFVVSFFGFIVNNHVVNADIMEARNLATAQEMVREGNYLMPTMNGELRLEKPPLPTWIAAAVEHISPDNLIAQRSMAGVSGMFFAFFLFLVVSRLTKNKDIGLIAALVLATCFNVIFMGRTATWDIYCHSFMLGGIYFLILAFEEKGKQWLNFLLAGLFMGLSFLSKGPVSFFALFLPFILSYSFLYRPKLKGKISPLISMIGLCLIISFWWPIFIMLFHHETLIAVANKESSSWIDHNVRPFYYYWKFPAEAGIWTLFWVTSLVWFFVKKNQGERLVFKMSIMWTILAVVLLSLIPEKKTRYLLPILIPAAINIAFYIYYSAVNVLSKKEKIVFRINSTLIAIILFALPIASYIFLAKEGSVSIPMTICILVISWVLGTFILKSTFNKSGIQVMRIFTAVILTMIMVESLCISAIGQLFINNDRHSIHLLRTDKRVEQFPFFYNENEELRMELVYESNKTIRPISIANDSLVYSKLPFVFVSALPIDSLFADKNVAIEMIDTFDNNWRKTGHKRSNPNLIRQVAILRAK